MLLESYVFDVQVYFGAKFSFPHLIIFIFLNVPLSNNLYGTLFIACLFLSTFIISFLN